MDTLTSPRIATPDVAEAGATPVPVETVVKMARGAAVLAMPAAAGYTADHWERAVSDILERVAAGIGRPAGCMWCDGLAHWRTRPTTYYPSTLVCTAHRGTAAARPIIRRSTDFIAPAAADSGRFYGWACNVRRTVDRDRKRAVETASLEDASPADYRTAEELGEATVYTPDTAGAHAHTRDILGRLGVHRLGRYYPLVYSIVRESQGLTPEEARGELVIPGKRDDAGTVAYGPTPAAARKSEQRQRERLVSDMGAWPDDWTPAPSADMTHVRPGTDRTIGKDVHGHIITRTGRTPGRPLVADILQVPDHAVEHAHTAPLTPEDRYRLPGLDTRVTVAYAPAMRPVWREGDAPRAAWSAWLTRRPKDVSAMRAARRWDTMAKHGRKASAGRDRSERVALQLAAGIPAA